MLIENLVEATRRTCLDYAWVWRFALKVDGNTPKMFEIDQLNNLAVCGQITVLAEWIGFQLSLILGWPSLVGGVPVVYIYIYILVPRAQGNSHWTMTRTVKKLQIKILDSSIFFFLKKIGLFWVFRKDLTANPNGVPLSEMFENLDTLVWDVC
jgi:hypothetical protein